MVSPYATTVCAGQPGVLGAMFGEGLEVEIVLFEVVFDGKNRGIHCLYFVIETLVEVILAVTMLYLLFFFES